MALLPNTALEERKEVASQVARIVGGQLSDAVVLVFGSVASGHVDARSDIDMLVTDKHLPDTGQRRRLTERLGGKWKLGESGDDPMFPLVDEGSEVQGVSVTVHYQQAAWVERVLTEVITQGAITTELMPFRPYTLAGLVQGAWVLRDPAKQVSAWQARLAIFPPALQRNLLVHFVPLLEEHVTELVANAERRLGPRVVLFNLNWAVDALVGVLYALNEVYDPADRRAEHTVWPGLQRVPKDFSQRLTDVLTGPFDDDTAVERAWRFQTLAREVLAEAARLGRV